MSTNTSASPVKCTRTALLRGLGKFLLKNEAFHSAAAIALLAFVFYSAIGSVTGMHNFGESPSDFTTSLLSLSGSFMVNAGRGFTAAVLCATVISGYALVADFGKKLCAAGQDLQNPVDLGIGRSAGVFGAWVVIVAATQAVPFALGAHPPEVFFGLMLVAALALAATACAVKYLALEQNPITLETPGASPTE